MKCRIGNISLMIGTGRVHHATLLFEFINLPFFFHIENLEHTLRFSLCAYAMQYNEAHEFKLVSDGTLPDMI